RVDCEEGRWKLPLGLFVRELPWKRKRWDWWPFTIDKSAGGSNNHH
ncbi:hypothetical protein L195_g062324, partial [Trifolium pratense]